MIRSFYPSIVIAKLQIIEIELNILADQARFFEQPVIESYKYFLNVIFIFKEFMSTILYINLARHFYIEANRLYN